MSARAACAPGQQNGMPPACDLIRGLQAEQAIATRYDKLAANFLGFIKLASTMLWLKSLN